MLNRRQFSTYLGLTVLGLLFGWLKPRHKVLYRESIGFTRMNESGWVQIQITPEIFMKGLRVSHVHP